MHKLLLKLKRVVLNRNWLSVEFKLNANRVINGWLRKSGFKGV